MRTRLWLASLIAAVALGCTSNSSDLFHDLGLINSSLDYPHSQKQLARCREVDHESCLKIYERVKSAKERLFARGRAEALRLTLDTISVECAKETVEIPCRGAVAALYFFPSAEDDVAIRKYLSTAAPLILVRTYEVDNAWLAVREEKASWREWAGESEWLSVDGRAAFLRGLDSDKRPGLTIEQL